MNTVQYGKEFSMSSGVKKKTTEKKDVAAGRAHVLSRHDEDGGMDVPIDLGGIAKGIVASAAGESDFVGAFSKEGVCASSQLTSGRGHRRRTPRSSVVDGKGLAAQELETRRRSLRTTFRSGHRRAFLFPRMRVCW